MKRTIERWTRCLFGTYTPMHRVYAIEIKNGVLSVVLGLHGAYVHFGGYR